MAYVRTNVVPLRNARGGRRAAENLIAALRCLYKRAEDEFLEREVEYHLSRTVMLRKFTTHQCNPGSSRN